MISVWFREGHQKISSTMQLFAKYACAMLINDVVSIWKLASNVHLISKLIQRGYRMFAFEERGPVDVSFFVDKRTSWLQYRAHIF